MTTPTSNTFFTFFIYLPFFSIFSVGLFYFGWDKVIISLFIVSIILCIMKYKLSVIKENIKDPYILILLVLSLYGSILYKTIGYGSGEIRTLIACLLFFLFFPKEKITTNALPTLLIIASVIAISFTFYSKYILHYDRATWPFNPITYSMSLCLFATCCLYFALKNKKPILFAAYVLLSIAILLTESRGPILSTLITSLLLTSLTTLTRKNIKKTFLIIVAFMSITIFLTQDTFTNRLEATNSEITKIIDGDYSTSIGLRLQMWLSAPYIIVKSPIWGVGDNFEEELNNLSNKKPFFKTISDFSPSHFHNQYIDKAVRSGFIGLFLCILIMYYPVYHCWTKSHSVDKDNLIIINALAINVTICSLTEVPMNQSFFLLPFLMLNYFLLREPTR